MTQLAAAGRVIQLVIGGADALVLARQALAQVAAGNAASTAAIAEEAAARQQAVTDEARVRGDGLAAEAAARSAADDAESQTRFAEDQALEKAFHDVAADRVSGDQAEAEARAAAIRQEAAARIQGLADEAEARGAALAELSDQLNASLAAGLASGRRQAGADTARWRAALSLASQRISLLETIVGPVDLAKAALAHAVSTTPARRAAGIGDETTTIIELPYSVSPYETLHLFIGGVEQQPGLDFQVYGSIVILQGEPIPTDTVVTHWKSVGEATVATAAGLQVAVTNPARFNPPAGQFIPLPYRVDAGETLHLWIGGVEQHLGLDFTVADTTATLLGDPLDGSTPVTHFKTALLAAGPDGSLDFSDAGAAALSNH